MYFLCMQGAILASSLSAPYKTYMYISFCDSWKEAVEHLWCHTTCKNLQCILGTLRF